MKQWPPSPAGCCADLTANRSTCATRLSAGGVADERVTQVFRQGDAKVFKEYSQMKSQMKREGPQKLNRKARSRTGFNTEKVN